MPFGAGRKPGTRPRAPLRAARRGAALPPRGAARLRSSDARPTSPPTPSTACARFGKPACLPSTRPPRPASPRAPSVPAAAAPAPDLRAELPNGPPPLPAVPLPGAGGFCGDRPLAPPTGRTRSTSWCEARVVLHARMRRRALRAPRRRARRKARWKKVGARPNPTPAADQPTNGELYSQMPLGDGRAALE
eukprot:365877-Chlamydomonas_euryale.AAC.3